MNATCAYSTFAAITTTRAKATTYRSWLKPAAEFVLSIYFGQNVSPQYLELSQELYRLFQAPLLRAKFVFKQKWFIQSIRPICVDEIPESHMEFVDKFAQEYFEKTRYASSKEEDYLYDLGILTNPDEVEPPSNAQATLIASLAVRSRRELQ